MTERFHFHFSLPCIGEGNGNPLQCSSLEIRRDGGAWWADVYGVAQNWTRLKRLSSSSGVFSNEAALRISWPKYGSFSISPLMNIQDLSPLGLTGLISLQSKGLSRVFTNTTVQKHPFFGTQLLLWSNSHIHT